MKRKVLGIVLAAVLCLSMAPATAMAADTEDVQIGNSTVTPDTAKEDSDDILDETQPEPEAGMPEEDVDISDIDTPIEEGTAAEIGEDSDTSAVPEAVANLMAEPAGHDTVVLKWEKAAKATKYSIYRSTQKNKGYVKLKTVGDVDTFKDKTVELGVTYFYKVLSFNGSIRGDYSKVVQSETELSKPASIKAVRNTYDCITVSWEVVPGATKYVVYRSYDEDGPYAKHTTTKLTAYMDTDLDTGVSYYYKVLPFKDGIRGVYSDVVSAKTTLDKLSGLKATARDDGTIKVSWNATAGADRYKVYRSTKPDGGSVLLTTLNDITTYIDRKAEEGVTYYYKVSPQCGMMNGGAVGPVSATAVNKDLLKAILRVGYSVMGTPYVTGGKTPAGFDCSGYVWYVLNNAGYNIGYMTSSQWRGANFPTYYSLSDAQPGDILCFNGHVGIYAGNGIMIDSGTGGVRETRLSLAYWQNNFRCIKRIL